MKTVFSFGAGVQSTGILGMMCKGLIPKSDYAVFSDPGAESEATYRHSSWCIELAAKHGITIDVVKGGDIWNDAITFAERRENAGIKRYASIPLFVKNNNGREGMMPRQCTKEYKIEPIEEYYRRVVLALKPRQRAPKTPAVEVLIGISADEERRATPPGRYKTFSVNTGQGTLGFRDGAEGGGYYFDEDKKVEKRWVPTPWQVKTFPLLGYTLYPDRSKVVREEYAEVAGFDRQDILDWFMKAFPGVDVPRSACVFCPYRTNKEWFDMKVNSPGEFAKAVEFDERIRAAYSSGQTARGRLAGLPFVHRKLIPLAQVDLSEPLNDRKGCGGLFSEEPDGICGV